MSNRDQLADNISRAVTARLGATTPEVTRVVAEEVARALAREEPSALERVVVAANGRNQPGIVARLSAAIDEFGGDIRDISQTIVGAYFTMLFVVDVSGATREGARFAQLRERLQQVGKDVGVHVVVLHDDILSTMHSI